MRAILFLTLLLSTIGVYSQTQHSLPSGTVPYSTNLYRSTDGSIWTGKTGSYTNLGNKQYVDSLASIGYTNEMIDSIALYNYDRARNRANHTGTQAQSTVVNLVSDLAGKENISNKSTTLASPNDTTYPTSKAVSDAIGAIDFPVTSVNTKTGDVVLSKSDVGLDSVDNTSDLNKPISNSTQSALDGKQDSLISGTNIKTINSESLLGSGNINIGGGAQTLQQVTDEGNTTSNRIKITGSDGSDETNGLDLYTDSVSAISSIANRDYSLGIGANSIAGEIRLGEVGGNVRIKARGNSSSVGTSLILASNAGEDPEDNLASFNSRVKGAPAVNSDEFVTKWQLDSVNRGINTELISGSTITINTDYQLNSCILSENTTITKPTGTIPDGVKVTLRIEASGASRNITWDSGFRPIGVTLPTDIPDAKYMYAEMYYLSSTDTWMVTYIAMEE